MARKTNGSTQYLENTVPPVTSGAVTIAVWWFREGTQAGTVCGIGDSNSGHYYALGATTEGKIFFGPADPTERDSTTTAKATTSAWSHIAGVWASSTSHTAYLNGTAATANTEAVSPTGLDRLTIMGLIINATRTSFQKGGVAHVAIWKKALSSAQIKELSEKKNPTKIEKANLVGYWELEKGESPEPSYKGETGTALTVTGATTTTGPEIEAAESGETVYTEVGEGTISVTGSATEALEVSEAAEGTISVTGSATEAAEATEAGSGTITVTGEGSELLEISESPSGTLTVTGAGSEAMEATETGEGTRAPTGSSVDEYGWEETGSGTITPTGSSTESLEFVEAPNGLIEVTGTATEILEYLEQQAGSMLLIGTKEETFETEGEEEPERATYIIEPVGMHHRTTEEPSEEELSLFARFLNLFRRNS